MDTTQLDELAHRVDSLETLKLEYETRIAALLEANTQLNSLVDELNVELNRQQFKQADYEEKISHQVVVEQQIPLQSTPSDVTAEVSELKEKLESTQQLNLKLKAKVKQLMAQTKASASANSDSTSVHELSTGNQELEILTAQKLDAENRVLHCEQENSNLVDSINKNKHQIESLQEENATLKAEVDELRQFKLENEGWTSEPQSNPNDLMIIQSLREANTTLGIELDQLRQLQFESESNLVTVRQEKHDLTEELISLKQQMSNNMTDLQQMDSLRAEIEKLAEEISSLRNLNAENENNSIALNHEKARLVDELNALIELKVARDADAIEIEALRKQNAYLQTEIDSLNQRTHVKPETLDFECQIDSLETSESDQLLIQSLRDANLVLSKELDELRHATKHATESSSIENESNIQLIQSLRDANTMLNLELDQYRKFKVDSEAYIANLLNEYGKLDALVREKAGKTFNEIECQTTAKVEEEDSDDGNGSELVQSLRDANAILNEQIEKMSLVIDNHESTILSLNAEKKQLLAELNGLVEKRTTAIDFEVKLTLNNF
jgi:hypothetical protein